MLTIWGRTSSINVQKVLWCCDELGIAYRRIDAGGAFGVTDSPEYLAMNPNKLVPTIEDEGFVLWESNVIVRYLAAKHGEGTLYPRELHRRFEAERWMDWQATTLWAALRVLFIGLIRTPPEKRDPAVLAEGQRNTERVLDILERHLANHAYVAGDAFTMGDIPVGASAYRWFALSLEKRSDFPNVARWYETLTQRPGFQAHVMQPLS
jgi:glutathione S-transferase